MVQIAILLKNSHALMSVASLLLENQVCLVTHKQLVASIAYLQH